MSLKNNITKGSIVFLLFTGGSLQAQADESFSREQVRAAMDSCHQELGIEKPEPGERREPPSDEVKAQMDACLKEKGFEPPKFAHGRGHGRQENEGSVGGVR